MIYKIGGVAKMPNVSKATIYKWDQEGATFSPLGPKKYFKTPKGKGGKKGMRVFGQMQLAVAIVLALITFSFFSCQHSPTTEDINTSDWKTYTNREYGFELMYPPDLTIQYPIKTYLGSVRFVRDSSVCFAVITNAISPKMKVEYKGERRLLSSLKLKDYFILALRKLCFSDNGQSYSDSKIMKLLKWREVGIGGTKGMQAFASDDECLNAYLPKSLVIRNNIRYWFQVFHGSSREFNKMISSFKFIE